MKICILFGTETGNAEMLAEDIETALQDDHNVTCANLADTDASALDPAAFHVFVCSTYGDGDLPSSAQSFANGLESVGPDLSALRFAIFGLGDAEYADTFTFGSIKLAALLTKRGAIQIGARLTHDASGDDMPEDLALPWITDILARIASETEDG